MTKRKWPLCDGPKPAWWDKVPVFWVVESPDYNAFSWAPSLCREGETCVFNTREKARKEIHRLHATYPQGRRTYRVTKYYPNWSMEIKNDVSV